MEAREDGGFHLFQKLHEFLSKHSKTPKDGTLKPSVNKQVLLVDIKQTLNNEFINRIYNRKQKTLYIIPKIATKYFVYKN